MVVVVIVLVATPASLVEGGRTVRVDTLHDLAGTSEVTSKDLLAMAARDAGDERNAARGDGHDAAGEWNVF